MSSEKCAGAAARTARSVRAAPKDSDLELLATRPGAPGGRAAANASSPTAPARRLAWPGAVAVVVAVAAVGAGCAYNPIGSFTATDFNLHSYRSVALTGKTGDRELAPLPPEVTKAAHAAVKPALIRQGYDVKAADKADLLVYAGLATGRSEAQVLVVRAADREREKLVWQRSEVLSVASTPESTTAAFKRLMARLPQAAGRPVAY